MFASHSSNVQPARRAVFRNLLVLVVAFPTAATLAAGVDLADWGRKEIVKLKDPDVSVRKMAAGSLGDFEGMASLKAGGFVHLDETWPARAEKVGREVARQIGAVPALIAALHDESLDVRETVIRSLHRIQDERALPALQQALADPVREVRVAAAEALLAFKRTDGLDVFLDGLQDEADEMRGRCAEDLARIKDPRALPALQAALERPPAPTGIRVPWSPAAIVAAIGAFPGPQATQGLVGALTHPNVLARKTAAIQLGQRHERLAVPQLIAALQRSGDDLSDEVPAAVAEALGAVGDPIAIPELEKLLAGDRDRWQKGDSPVVEQAAANALWVIRSEEALRALVRQRVWWVFDEAKDSATVAALTWGISFADPHVRRGALMCLSRIGGPAVVPLLLEAARDPVGEVRETAREAVVETQDPRAMKIILERLSEGPSYAQEPPLSEEEFDRWVKQWDEAARALAMIGGEASFDTLSKMWSGTDLPNSVLGQQRRYIAFHAICQLNDRRAEPIVRAGLTDSDEKVRDEAANALRQMTGQSRHPATRR